MYMEQPHIEAGLTIDTVNALTRTPRTVVIVDEVGEVTATGMEAIRRRLRGYVRGGGMGPSVDFQRGG